MKRRQDRQPRGRLPPARSAARRRLENTPLHLQRFPASMFRRSMGKTRRARGKSDWPTRHILLIKGVIVQLRVDDSGITNETRINHLIASFEPCSDPPFIVPVIP